jgi:hypothetical protein
MSQLLRFISMVVVLLLVVLSPALLHPEWANDLGLDTFRAALQPYPGPCQQVLAAEQEQRLQASVRRIEKKTRIIEQMVAGRVTLFETAAHFRRWNDEYPILPPHPMDEGDSYEERLCSQVIGWARGWLSQHDPDGADELAARLRDEVRCHKAMHGRVVLPEVGDAD